jgi:hypothetical protein
VPELSEKMVQGLQSMGQEKVKHNTQVLLTHAKQMFKGNISVKE